MLNAASYRKVRNRRTLSINESNHGGWLGRGVSLGSIAGGDGTMS